MRKETRENAEVVRETQQMIREIRDSVAAKNSCSGRAVNTQNNRKRPADDKTLAESRAAKVLKAATGDSSTRARSAHQSGQDEDGVFLSPVQEKPSKNRRNSLRWTIAWNEPEPETNAAADG